MPGVSQILGKRVGIIYQHPVRGVLSLQTPQPDHSCWQMPGVIKVQETPTIVQQVCQFKQAGVSVILLITSSGNINIAYQSCLERYQEAINKLPTEFSNQKVSVLSIKEDFSTGSVPAITRAAWSFLKGERVKPINFFLVQDNRWFEATDLAAAFSRHEQAGSEGAAASIISQLGPECLKHNFGFTVVETGQASLSEPDYFKLNLLDYSLVGLSHRVFAECLKNNEDVERCLKICQGAGEEKPDFDLRWLLYFIMMKDVGSAFDKQPFLERWPGFFARVEYGNFRTWKNALAQ